MVPLVLIALLLLVLAPGLAIAVGVGLLLFLPAYLMVSSALTVVLAPQQMYAVATDKRTRRTHSCEHATVNVLEGWYGPQPAVGGVATKDGFYVWGAEGFDPGALIRAAQSGLARMKNGERDLALHPRCGTSLMAARLVFAIVFLALLFAVGGFTLSGVLIALLASWAFGRPLGMLAQRYFTTSSEVGALHISEVRWTDQPRVAGMPLFGLPRGAYFFRTAGQER